MMNKEQLIELVNSLELPVDEFYILGSGSLLLYGIRQIANDLNLCVSNELFKILATKYVIKEKNSCGFYQLTDNIEIVINSKQDFTRDFVNGYPVEKLERILEFKKSRNKEKDQDDIGKIIEYINFKSIKKRKH